MNIKLENIPMSPAAVMDTISRKIARCCVYRGINFSVACVVCACIIQWIRGVDCYGWGSVVCWVIVAAMTVENEYQIRKLECLRDLALCGDIAAAINGLNLHKGYTFVLADNDATEAQP